MPRPCSCAVAKWWGVSAEHELLAALKDSQWTYAEYCSAACCLREAGMQYRLNFVALRATDSDFWNACPGTAQDYLLSQGLDPAAGVYALKIFEPREQNP